MSNYIDDFINYIRDIRNYSDYTEENYLHDLEEYEKYLKTKRISFKNITYKIIVDYTKYLKETRALKATSINRHLSSIRSFYNYLVLECVLTSNPFNLIRGPKKESKLPNYMKYNEFESLIEACDNTFLGIRNKALLELLLSTGTRIGELIQVELSDIDLKKKELKVLGKGNKMRICFFNEHALIAINNYLNNSRTFLLNGKETNRLFVNRLGGNLTERGVRVILDKIIKKSAVNTKISPHTFRHTFATMLLNEGADLKTVQELLGHANMSTTSIYTHVSNDLLKSVYLKNHPRAKK